MAGKQARRTRGHKRRKRSRPHQRVHLRHVLHAKKFRQVHGFTTTVIWCEVLFRECLGLFGHPTRSSAAVAVPTGLRTCDLRFRKPLLYPAELRDLL